MLLLKRHLVLLVRQGLKRQTLRLWTRALVRVGQLSYTPGLGRMKILAVDLLPALDSLTEEDARADGFKSLRELRAELRKIYGPASKPAVKIRQLFRIKFEWPVDAAGEKLVLPAPIEPAPEGGRVRKSVLRKSTLHGPASRIAPARPKSRRRTAMTATQRRKLRDFILHNAPGG